MARTEELLGIGRERRFASAYVGGDRYTLAPDGTYVGGDSYRLAPDGTYVGVYDRTREKGKWRTGD